MNRLLAPRAAALAMLPLCFSFAAWAATGAEPAWPLRVSDDHRHLADQKGNPFLVVGDTPWSLIVQLSEADIERYLDDRQKKGFNSLIVNLIEHKFSSHPPRTKAGLSPFLTPDDFSTPNPAYFAFAHEVVKKAHQRGIAVWLAPAYLGYNGGDEGWFRAMKASGKDALRHYGRFVGERFRDLPNVIWLMGGDYTPPASDRWVVNEMAEGIRERDPAHLMAAHPSPGQSSAPAFGEPVWLDVNGTYSYVETLFEPLEADYRRQPVRPFVLLESRYENEHDAPRHQIRRQAYWAMLAGAGGQFFGNNPIWHFDGPGLHPTDITWQQALDGPGSQDMARLGQLFRSLPWSRLVPDLPRRLLANGAGDGAGRASVARTAEGKLAVCYFPSTGTAARPFAVDLAQMAGPATARWFNPVTGQFTSLGGSPLPNRGNQRFYTPGANGAQANDWVLLLEVK